jgi:hypothetical protein
MASDDEEGSSDEGSSQFVVEAILDKRIVGGKAEYLIKWQGYNDPDDNTWEPIENCVGFSGFLCFEFDLRVHVRLKNVTITIRIN